MKPRPRQTGVTFIELVTSIVIISIALLGIMLAISATVGRSADPMIQEQASAIAQAYLEEVLLANFCDPSFDPDADPSTGCRIDCSGAMRACRDGCGGAVFSAESGRDQFDDVCDYDALSDVGARDRLGNPIAGLEGYTVTVAIEDAGVQIGPPALLLDSDAGQVVRVDVSVTHAFLQNDLRASAVRSNFE